MEQTTFVVQPFPELPSELVFLIIETLLEIEPKRALHLVCLSRDIRPIAEKALYRSVILETPEVTDLFFDMIRSGCRSVNFYHERVKTLCLYSSVDVHVLAPIFSACLAAQTIGIYQYDERDDSDEEIEALDALASTGPCPSRLSCLLSWTNAGRRLLLPLFERVTHLELYDLSDFEAFDGKQLHSLTNLTHLCFTMNYPETASVLRLVDNLFLTDSVVVCILYSRVGVDSMKQFLALVLPSDDPRVVIALPPLLEPNDLSAYGIVLWRNIFDKNYFRQQWGRRSSGIDMWEEAEAIVNHQRAIQASTVSV
ncbi:hypothetical protein C8J56DRAFT_1065218 [Mycena floridula]|nr:hypothetical protein C8J56DRAFT_1065218 [Mycena floridula]